VTATAIVAKHVVISSGAFSGLDQRAGSSVGIKSLPHIVNFSVDEGGALRKRNGYEVVDRIKEDTPVTALWRGKLEGKELSFAVIGGGIYALGDKDKSYRLIGQTGLMPEEFTPFGNGIYCLAEELFRCFDDRIETVEGYVPLVATACTPAGQRTVYEQPNLLSAKRRVRYNADGISVTYSLPEKDFIGIVSVSVDGEVLDSSKYTPFFESGAVDLAEPPKKGINNVEICYEVKPNYKLKRLITGCKYATVFENRLFVFGNPNYPDRVYHSELADGIPSCEYFTETGYHAFEKEVTALIPCYNRLLIFFEDSACFTFAELKTNSVGESFTSFPVYELHGSKGCIISGIGCSFDNTPVTLCKDGLNKWVSTAIADERSAVVFSERAFKFVTEVLWQHKKLKLYNRRSHSELWFCTNLGTLIYNYALDCFYFYDLCDIYSLHEYGRDLWLGLEDGRVCRFNEESVLDGDKPIVAKLETPYCSFGAPYELKSLYGVNICFYGKNAVKAKVSITRGNLSEKQKDAATVQLGEIEEDGFRRVKKRLHLKRFYSCKLQLSTEAEQVRVTEIQLFAKQLGGGIRVN